MAQHILTKHPLVLRKVRVARVHDLTSRMRRITLVGDQLRPFHNGEFDLPGFVSEAFDDHVKLVFAADGDIDAALPVQRARSIDWPASEHRQGRDYTPRRWDAEAGELDLDFVLHGDGPAAAWAAGAKPGDVLHFAGPKTSLVFPDDIDWVLLAGDETALPAIGRYLDERPLDVPVRVVVEIRDHAARLDLAVREGDTIRWIHTPAHAPSALPDAVREVQWLPGNPYVWAAGESRSLVSLRNWLRRERNLSPSHVNVTGYWHHEPGSKEGHRAVPDAAELLDPVPWLATRAAVELGLLEELGHTPVGLDVLAEKVVVDRARLRTLLAYLESIAVVRSGAGGFAIGPVGDQLLDNDHVREELFGSGAESRALDALTGLAPALRAGMSAWQHTYTRTLAEEIEHDPRLYAEQIEESGAFSFVASGVFDLPVWKQARRIVLTGPGALALANAASERHALTGVVLTGGPVAREAFDAQRGDLPVPVLDSEQVARTDLVVSTLETHYRNDSELADHLAKLADYASHALAIDALRRTGPGGPQGTFEHDFVQLGMTGLAPRRHVDIERIASQAGWRMTESTPLGWDYEVFDLRR